VDVMILPQFLLAYDFAYRVSMSMMFDKIANEIVCGLKLNQPKWENIK